MSAESSHIAQVTLMDPSATEWPTELHGMLTTSAPMRAVFQTIHQAVATDFFKRHPEVLVVPS